MENLNELLEEAKRRYPIGTKYKCVNGNINVIDSTFIVSNYKTLNTHGIYSNYNGWIYLLGKWAEIVSEPELEELPEAWYVVVTEENMHELYKWRFGENCTYGYHNWIIGICKQDYSNPGIYKYEKGYNLAHLVKGGHYDFGQEISYEDFKRLVLKQTDMKEEKQFILPENWCIYLEKETEEIEYFCKWVDKQTNSSRYFSGSGGYYYNTYIKNTGFGCCGSVLTGYTEITFKEFKSAIEATKLKEEVLPNKQYSLETIKQALLKDYDKSDVDDIIKVIADSK